MDNIKLQVAKLLGAFAETQKELLKANMTPVTIANRIQELEYARQAFLSVIEEYPVMNPSSK